MDRDGKVNFKEFFHGLFDLVRNYDEGSYNVSRHFDDSMDASARVLFSQLDKDGDGYLVYTFSFSIIILLSLNQYGSFSIIYF
jgi:hypothetical protein